MEWLSLGSVLALTHPGGKVVRNIKSITLVNNTAKTEDITVPAGKRWVILSGKICNPDNVARAVSVTHYDSSLNILERIVNARSLAANGEIAFPSEGLSALSENNMETPIIAVATDVIRFYYATGGASAGGTDAQAVHLSVLELPMT